MGLEYGIFDFDEKEYIRCGKWIQGRGFQIDYDKLAGFLATRCEARLQVISDGACPPTEEDGFKKVADWCEDDE